MSGQSFLPLYEKDRPSLERQNDEVEMIERRDKEDKQTQNHKDLLLMNNYDGRKRERRYINPSLQG